MDRPKIPLTNEAYYEERERLSASTIKAFRRCEAAALASWRGEYEIQTNTAMLIGSYVDAYFSGELEEFRAKHPELFKRDGTLKAEFVQAEEMIRRARRDKCFMSFMEGDHQKILEGEIGGLPFKAKLDVYNPAEKFIADLKTTKDMQPVYVPGQGRVDFASAWDWPLQLAIYRELAPIRCNCFLNVITKETPPDIAVIEVPEERLDAEIEILKTQLPRIEAVIDGVVSPTRCGHCAYCRATKVLDGVISLDEFEDFGGNENE